MHCILRSATLDTVPVEPDFKLPKDGRMHTMSLGIEGSGGVILAIKSPGPGSAGDVTPQDVLRSYCESGHRGGRASASS